jgi:hypothetical protein
MLWITGLIVAIGALAVAALVLIAYGNARWAEATRALLGRLEVARLPPTASHYDARELEGLPAPVQRYFHAVLKDGQRIITAAMVEHTGTFNLSQTGERWKPFTSQQRVVTRRPGFVWNGRVAVMPGTLFQLPRAKRHACTVHRGGVVVVTAGAQALLAWDHCFVDI